MKQYLRLVEKILNEGENCADRTGVGTIALFGETLKFDLRKGFPLLTTKKVYWKSVVEELLWFLRGDTNIKTLGNKIWNEWADEEGDLGPIYGYQWTHWDAYDEQEDGKFKRRPEGINQVRQAIELIKTNPSSRRIIVNAWNPADLDKMGLPPCHLFYQFKVFDTHLDLIWYQRSCDLGLGVPFNIASYALLLTMVANECGLTPGVLTGMLGDAHVYTNHVDALREQLTRTPGTLPTVDLPKGKPVFEITFEDIVLSNYNPQPPIKMAIAV